MITNEHVVELPDTAVRSPLPDALQRVADGVSIGNTAVLSVCKDAFAHTLCTTHTGLDRNVEALAQRSANRYCHSILASGSQRELGHIQRLARMCHNGMLDA
jgi:hypothetical protein